MTEILTTTNNIDQTNEIIQDLEFETFEQARERIVGEAVVARTINLDMRHDSSFPQSKTPEAFVD